MATERPARFLRSIRLLTLELVIVFVGVYGAFWVDNYRDRQEQAQNAALLAEALRRDLRDVVDVTHQFMDSIDSGLRQWEEQRSRGETPPPFVFRIDGSEVPPAATWEAALQAEAAKLFDPALLFDLGFFYNEISGMAHRYVRYAEFTEAEVLPRLKPGGGPFYTEDGQHLLPRFAAHMDRLREYRSFMEESLEWADCLLDRLEVPRQRTESCWDKAGASTP